MTRYHSFSPIVGNDPKLLILGTFPSPISRKKHEYYGNTQNSFWRIVSDIFSLPLINTDYERKKKALCANRIALWDIVASCYVTGAADTGIKEPVFNDIMGFLSKYPGIRAIVFNGHNSHRFCKKHLGLIPVDSVILPSTSPANARYTYGWKLLKWKETFKIYLDDTQS